MKSDKSEQWKEWFQLKTDLIIETCNNSNEEMQSLE